MNRSITYKNICGLSEGLEDLICIKSQTAALGLVLYLNERVIVHERRL